MGQPRVEEHRHHQPPVFTALDVGLVGSSKVKQDLRVRRAAPAKLSRESPDQLRPDQLRKGQTAPACPDVGNNLEDVNQHRDRQNDQRSHRHEVVPRDPYAVFRLHDKGGLIHLKYSGK